MPAQPGRPIQINHRIACVYLTMRELKAWVARNRSRRELEGIFSAITALEDRLTHDHPELAGAFSTIGGPEEELALIAACTAIAAAGERLALHSAEFGAIFQAIADAEEHLELAEPALTRSAAGQITRPAGA